jgi:hypothetical protein
MGRAGVWDARQALLDSRLIADACLEIQVFNFHFVCRARTLRWRMATVARDPMSEEQRRLTAEEHRRRVLAALDEAFRERPRP